MGTRDNDSQRQQVFIQRHCGEVLAASPLFTGLAAAELDPLAARARVRVVPDGQTVFRRGDAADALFVVDHGVFLLSTASKAEDKRIGLFWARQGDVLGEAGVLATERTAEGWPDGTPEATSRHCDVQAVGIGAVIVLDGRSLRPFLDRHPPVVRRLAGIAAARQRRVVDVLERALFSGAEIRLAAAILERAGYAGTRDGVVVRMARLSHQDLAHLIGADRRTVLETIHLWERAGLVHHRRDGTLVILDPKGLSAIARRLPGQRKSWETESWLVEIDALLARGHNGLASDLCADALRRPALARSTDVRHRTVLALARAGATGQAQALLERFGFNHRHENEDIAALEPRLLKDQSLAEPEPGRRAALAAEAARGYGAIFARTGGYYVGVNAATLSLVAGDTAAATALAGQVPAHVPTDDRRYYARATLGEAALVAGDEARAKALFGQAMQAPDASPGTVATTRRQIGLICAARGRVPDGLLTSLPQPDVLCYVGCPLPEPAADQARPVEAIATGLRRWLAHRTVGWGHGSLAWGGDILVAEALLDHGAEVHVVLPFRASDFAAAAVLPGGRSWVDRYHRCLDRAHRVRLLSEDGYDGDALDFDLGRRFFLGLARRQALDLATDCTLLKVSWDGNPATDAADAAATALWRATDQAVALWESTGGHAAHIDCPTGGRRPSRRPPATETGFFAVVLVYGSATDPLALPADRSPTDEMVGALRPDPVVVNGALAWVFPHLADAARAALRVADSARERGEPLRIVCDVGRPKTGADPAMTTVWRSRLLRSNPAVPAGIPYASEPFLAEAALSAAGRIHAEYVGLMPSSADEPPQPLYVLTAVSGG